MVPTQVKCTKRLSVTISSSYVTNVTDHRHQVLRIFLKFQVRSKTKLHKVADKINKYLFLILEKKE